MLVQFVFLLVQGLGIKGLRAEDFGFRGLGFRAEDYTVGCRVYRVGTR